MSVSIYWTYPKTECNMLQQTMITQSVLKIVYVRGLQEMEKMKFENCQVDQERTQLKLSFNSNLDSAVWGAETEGIHLERAGGVVYLYRCYQN